jgi:hypothetical protein
MKINYNIAAYAQIVCFVKNVGSFNSIHIAVNHQVVVIGKN